MRGDDAGAADEHLALDRGDDDGRILLRHAQGIAADVLVDDQVADDHDAQIGKARRQPGEVDDPEAVTRRIVGRLADGRELGLRVFALEQRPRCESRLAGAEDQPAAVGFDGRLLGIDPSFVLPALDDDVGLEPRDELLGGLREGNRLGDRSDRPNAGEPVGLGHGDTNRVVGIDADHQGAAHLGGKAQQAEVTGMQNIEVARHEDDRALAVLLSPDLVRNALHLLPAFERRLIKRKRRRVCHGGHA